MKNTKFINNSNLDKEAQHRIDSLKKGLAKQELRSFHKRLIQLKSKLCNNHNDSLANIYYISTLQKEISDNIKTVLSQYKSIAQTDKNIFMVTLNYCEGRGKNKIPYFIKPEELINFNVKKAKATIRRQFNRLNKGFGFITFEVKYDSRIGAFLPHFHIIICGEDKKSLEDYFTKYFPSNYDFMLNPDTFKISKNGDPLIYRTPQNLKVIDIRPIEDDEPISTYVCKFKTYASLAVQKHLTATVEDEMTDNKKRKRKKISVPDEIHCYNLMFLDQCHLSDVFYKFNTKLMTKFVGNTSKVSASNSIKLNNSPEGLAKIQKKAPKHETYCKPLTNNKQKQLNKIVYDVLNKAFAHKMKSFPSKFKKKLSGIFSDITPKQFFNLNYFDAHEHRCCLCGRLLDHDAKELPVAEIEHLFPQSKFPQLILCISNYIPCCSNCNKIKKSSFFSCKKEFIEDLQKLGKSFHHPLFFLKLFDANFDYNLPAVKKCDIVQYYKINERFNQIRHYMYSNLFNLVKYHNIETPEALESFLESCQNANMQEMVSDFSLNNHPKLWHDFIDYVLYDYNNLTALWEEIKEYNKLKYYC
ncbi:MAG: hypothetical protein EGQ57_08845 [Alphaproteobacteria bacterium]|nr:hypothetical protein [Alphaproteobacteria bacterium]